MIENCSNLSGFFLTYRYGIGPEDLRFSGQTLDYSNFGASFSEKYDGNTYFLRNASY